MKKMLFAMSLACIMGIPAMAVSPTYMNPSAGTMDFYPMMQTQMEKEETLDFVNEPEKYKEKRDKKDKKITNTNFNPNYSPNYGGSYLYPVYPSQMQFTRDANGNIKIQSTQPNPSTIIDAVNNK